MKSGDSVSCALAHCSARGVRASKQSWETSDVILRESQENCRNAYSRIVILILIITITAIVEIQIPCTK